MKFAALEKRFFDFLYVAFKDNSLHKLVMQAAMFVDFFQLLALALSSKFNWSTSMAEYLAMMVSLFSVPVKSLPFWLFAVILVLCLVAIVLIIGIVIIVTIDIQEQRFESLLPIQTARLGVALGVTILFLPISTVLLTTFTPITDPAPLAAVEPLGSSPARFILYPTTAAVTVAFSVLGVMCAVGLFDPYIHSKAPMARCSCRFDLYQLLCKALAIIVFTFFKDDPTKCSVAIFASSLTMVISLIYYTPYYRSIILYTRLCLLTTVFGASAAALCSMVIDFPQWFKADYLIIILPVPFCVVSCFVQHRRSTVFRSDLKNLPSNPTRADVFTALRPVFSKSTATINIVIRGIIKHTTEETKVHDAAVIDGIVSGLTTMLPLVPQASLFALMAYNAVHGEFPQALLDHLKSLKVPYDLRYLTHRLQKDRSQTNTSILGEIKLNKLRTLAEGANRMYASEQSRFWSNVDQASQADGPIYDVALDHLLSIARHALHLEQRECRCLAQLYRLDQGEEVRADLTRFATTHLDASVHSKALSLIGARVGSGDVKKNGDKIEAILAPAVATKSQGKTRATKRVVRGTTGLMLGSNLLTIPLLSCSLGVAFFAVVWLVSVRSTALSLQTLATAAETARWPQYSAHESRTLGSVTVDLHNPFGPVEVYESAPWEPISLAATTAKRAQLLFFAKRYFATSGFLAKALSDDTSASIWYSPLDSLPLYRVVDVISALDPGTMEATLPTGCGAFSPAAMESMDSMEALNLLVALTDSADSDSSRVNVSAVYDSRLDSAVTNQTAMADVPADVCELEEYSMTVSALAYGVRSLQEAGYVTVVIYTVMAGITFVFLGKCALFVAVVTLTTPSLFVSQRMNQKSFSRAFASLIEQPTPLRNPVRVATPRGQSPKMQYMPWSDRDQPYRTGVRPRFISGGVGSLPRVMTLGANAALILVVICQAMFLASRMISTVSLLTFVDDVDSLSTGLLRGVSVLQSISAYELNEALLPSSSPTLDDVWAELDSAIDGLAVVSGILSHPPSFLDLYDQPSLFPWLSIDPRDIRPVTVEGLAATRDVFLDPGCVLGDDSQCRDGWLGAPLQAGLVGLVDSIYRDLTLLRVNHDHSLGLGDSADDLVHRCGVLAADIDTAVRLAFAAVIDDLADTRNLNVIAMAGLSVLEICLIILTGVAASKWTKRLDDDRSAVVRMLRVVRADVVEANKGLSALGLKN
ncbi:HAT repeat-containing protein [Carpediemonas membranifera]|uniref:HAT repeat-containing protein n=1 Tax=Carpediemonas membranifera TaxID=201153 RepID=A0A8J6E263_9EUKA|nr:HAT repeat-containing protein [Carpediemonas membranifera]|eukprot:KAG9391507.1 HAT repeat-containing protein [Carpediemonas membranifera]